jgi:curli biogenesis system outer membrane secretion channel CsgG
MDRLFLQFDRSDMVITSAGIPDATEVIAAGTKDMLISSISRMSRQSDAFTFVDYDATQTDVHELQGLAGFDEDFLIPDFYIRGAITQFDEGVLDESVGFSTGYDANFGRSEEIEDGKFKRKGVISYGANADANQNVAVVSLDLNVADLSTRQIISGISAHNSIAVSRTSVLGGFGGQISKMGANFAIELNRSEGLHQAVRTLIELSTIEVLGKLAEVPFWRCLEIDHTNPAVVAEAREWFEGMDEDERIEFVQTTLASKGAYGGQASGVMDKDTQNAIARYQAQNDLIADGRINFDLYARLLNDKSAPGVQPAAQPVAVRSLTIDRIVADVEEEPALPLDLELVSNESPDGTFEVNRELHFSASASRSAHVYCYYADAAGNVARVFPNQFQPDSFVPAGQAAKVPGDHAGFDIVLDQAGADEEVACIASIKELALRLPEEFKMPDLTPIPDQSLDDIVEAYEDLDEDDIVQAWLDLKVR